MDTETTEERSQSDGSARPYQEAPGELPGTDSTNQDLLANLEITGTEYDDVLEGNSTALSVSSYHGIPAALSHRMAEFLSSDQLAKMKNLLQMHLLSPVGNPEIPGEGCPLLYVLNLDCRRLIWKCLLLNPLLGESFAIDDDQDSFGLFPTILRLNRQIYDEGIDILYGCNKFMVQCPPQSSHDPEYDHFTLCALTRYEQIDLAYRGVKEDYDIIPAAKYVRHWKIVLSATVPDPHINNGLLLLCRNICTANIQSTEVLIIPRGIERSWHSSETYSDERQLAQTLAPLERLKNIGRFIIRAAEFDEIPKVALSDREELAIEFTPILPDPVDEVRLITLIEGNSDVKIIEGMYMNLLAYVQNFERIEEFRLDMRRVNADDMDEMIEKNILQPFELENSDFDVCEIGTEYFTSSNPFTSSSHPVESALRAAKFAMVENNLEKFEIHRTKLIHYLEPQYQAIEAASRDLVDFIKNEKRPDGLFDHRKDYHAKCLDEATEAMVLLEDYASSIARRLERETRVTIRKQKLLFDSRYDALPREQLLKSCEMAYEKQWWSRLVNTYRETVDDMDTQYLAIREARKKLYAWDLKSTVHETASTPMVLDRPIDWYTYEPDMRINEESHEYRSYPHNESLEHENDYGSEHSDNDWSSRD
ncbi:hypothetical protein BOTCAL_0244g00050 [Botryotinia calthae]|uniref:Uncharacterized protein n=1 Tax=Botryotinia calthae TaxID=38488 RepID=A0A4Y8CWW3_9HELO|nr:hypothetical protein BOTCAL_0244g00050 [Botryotinia calthae]